MRSAASQSTEPRGGSGRPTLTTRRIACSCSRTARRRREIRLTLDARERALCDSVETASCVPRPSAASAKRGGDADLQARTGERARAGARRRAAHAWRAARCASAREVAHVGGVRRRTRRSARGAPRACAARAARARRRARATPARVRERTPTGDRPRSCSLRRHDTSRVRRVRPPERRRRRSRDGCEAHDDRAGAATSAKWQATGCSPPARGTSAGSSSAQISCAFQQRVRKRQPDGGFAGLGTSPSSTIRERLPRCVGRLDRHGREQRLRVRVHRRVVDLVARPDLDDLAEVHDGDAVGDVADDREVVRDEEVRQPELRLQLARGGSRPAPGSRRRAPRPARRAPSSSGSARARVRRRSAGAGRRRTRAGSGSRARARDRPCAGAPRRAACPHRVGRGRGSAAARRRCRAPSSAGSATRTDPGRRSGCRAGPAASACA